MHKLVKDETGSTYGRLTVVERAQDARRGLATWRCECICGEVVNVPGSSLRNGNTKSCGCLALEARSSTGRITGPKNFGNRKKRPPELIKPKQVYTAAKQRCTNPNNKDYARYGGRGIEFLFSSFGDFWTHLGIPTNPASL